MQHGYCTRELPETEGTTSFHLYTINELYSNADGSAQFIEMTVGNVNGEGFWAGNIISVSQGGTTHSFTFPTDLPSELTTPRY